MIEQKDADGLRAQLGSFSLHSRARTWNHDENTHKTESSLMPCLRAYRKGHGWGESLATSVRAVCGHASHRFAVSHASAEQQQFRCLFAPVCLLT